MVNVSSGILVYRIFNNQIEVLLGKNGGPQWEHKKQSWNIPKGLNEPGQSIFQNALREFQEETSLKFINVKADEEKDFIYLGCSCTKSRKVVHIYSIQYDFNKDFSKKEVEIKSNYCEIQWPSNFGNFISIPEISQGKYFDIDQAYQYIFPYQIVFLDRLKDYLKNKKEEG